MINDFDIKIPWNVNGIAIHNILFSVGVIIRFFENRIDYVLLFIIRLNFKEF